MESYNLTQPELEKMKPDTAILPFASLEQHGAHLPMSTDCISTEAFANRIADKMNAFQIPTIPIRHAESIWVRWEAYG